MTKPNEPAFPGGISATPTASDDALPTQSGMTLREYFAAKAIQGLIAGVHSSPESTKLMAAFSTSEGDVGMSKTVAELAVDYADALIEELAKAASESSSRS